MSLNLHINKHACNILAYLFCASLVVVAFTGCANHTMSGSMAYRCDPSSLSMCDKKHLSCHPVPIVSFNEPVTIVFEPGSNTVTSFEGSKLLNTAYLKFWQRAADSILLGGYGINIKGDATAWTGSINTSNGEMILSALSLEYSYIILGSCRQHD